MVFSIGLRVWHLLKVMVITQGTAFPRSLLSTWSTHRGLTTLGWTGTLSLSPAQLVVTVQQPLSAGLGGVLPSSWQPSPQPRTHGSPNGCHSLLEPPSLPFATVLACKGRYNKPQTAWFKLQKVISQSWSLEIQDKGVYVSKFLFPVRTPVWWIRAHPNVLILM